MNSGAAGKKSFGKMSALQALTFESEDDDADEERRLTDRVQAIKNQFLRIESGRSNNNSSNDRFSRNNHNHS